MIIRLALPLMAAYLAQKGMQLTDTIMMGWLGPYALAAGALGMGLFWINTVFCMGSLSAVGVLISRARGANQPDEIEAVIRSGLCMALLLALPLMLLIWFTPYGLSGFGEDPRVVENVRLLLHGLVWGIPGLLLFMVFREYLAAFGLVRVVMWVTFASIPLTFFANYGLIYGKFALPALGIAGMGYAGAVVMWLMFLGVWLYSRRQVTIKKYIAGLGLGQFNRKVIRQIFVLGAPSGLIIVMDVGMFFVSAILMGRFGVTQLAAYQIALQYASIAYALPMAVANATALRVGHAAGAGQFPLVKCAANIGLILGILLSLLIAGIFILAPEFLLKLFLSRGEANYAEILQLGVAFLSIAALFQVVDATQVVVNGALRGLKDTLVPMLISLGGYWLIGIGSAYYFAFCTQVGAIGIWYGISLGIGSSAIVLVLRLVQKIRREGKGMPMAANLMQKMNMNKSGGIT